MLKVIKLLILLVIIASFSSCIPKKKLLYTQDQKEKDEQNEYVNIRPEKTIQPFDNIYIKVSSIDEKTASIFDSQTRNASEININLLSYTVNQSGYINFPFVGEIFVKNMTLPQAQVRIEEEVGEYLPNISISVKFVNNTVSVLGEVKRPGEYAFYRDQITIFQALSFASGITDYGNKQKVILVREAKNKINYYYLDLTNKNIVSSEYYYIIPNDVLIVKPIRAKFRNLSLVNLPIFLATITTLSTLYILFYK
ncbi:MAG: polysaccharide biosynthesis/export family protein [Bacteroidales bacterium]|nr:polysaccharide biosynthesis/export family protein [Bacteroidales bacterium]MCF8405333.1 polysaccharide biosynthesis/export family protein [Bacteroidales bacterium]